MFDDDLDDLPDISVSEATSDVIKSGELYVRQCRKNAQIAFEMAERAEQYAEMMRALGRAYAKAGKRAILDVADVLAMEWDLPTSDDEAEAQEAETEGDQ